MPASILRIAVTIVGIGTFSVFLGGIPRWQLEGGSRKQASYSEILERRWRHFAGIITEKRHNFDPSTSPAGAESPLHVKRRNQEGPRAASHWRPYGLGRRGPGELRGTAVPLQTSLGQSSIAPWTD
jgi:hypothetical protein